MAAKEDPSLTKYKISKLNLMYFSDVVMLITKDYLYCNTVNVFFFTGPDLDLLELANMK